MWYHIGVLIQILLFIEAMMSDTRLTFSEIKNLFLFVELLHFFLRRTTTTNFSEMINIKIFKTKYLKTAPNYKFQTFFALTGLYRKKVHF